MKRGGKITERNKENRRKEVKHMNVISLKLPISTPGDKAANVTNTTLSRIHIIKSPSKNL